MKMNKYECHCADTDCILESNKRPTFCPYYSHIAPDWQLVVDDVPNLERWKPNYNEIYYIVDTITCGVNYYIWHNDEIDRDFYGMGNVFRTKEEAEKAIKMVKELLLSLHGENEK